MMDPNRRKIFLCDKVRQWRYLKQILMMEFLVALVCVPLTAFVTLFFLSRDTVLTGSAYWTQTFFIVLFSCLLLAGVLVYIGARLSNRIYGPIYRFNKIFQEALERREIPTSCVIRDHDEFKDLADNIDRFFQWLNTRDRKKSGG